MTGIASFDYFFYFFVVFGFIVMSYVAIIHVIKKG